MQQRLHTGRVRFLIRLGIVLRQMAGKPNKFRVRLINGHAGLQPSHHGRRRLFAPTCKSPARPERKLIVKRNPELFRNRELKIWRHDANDRGGLAVNSDVLTDDIRIAIEIALPDLVTENGHLLRARLVVLGGEIAPKDRRDADES